MFKILLVLILLALVVYGLVRVIERRGVAIRPREQRPDPRVFGPDDDDDFLRDIDRKRRTDDS